MDSAVKSKLAENDLCLLHNYFHSDSNPTEIKFTPASLVEDGVNGYPVDLWSQAIYLIDDNNKSALIAIRDKIMKSSFSKHEKNWWSSLISVELKAPLDELKLLCSSRTEMPDTITDKCVDSAAYYLSLIAYQDELEQRDSATREEKRKLNSLNKEVEARQRDKAAALSELDYHRRYHRRDY